MLVIDLLTLTKNPEAIQFHLYAENVRLELKHNYELDICKRRALAKFASRYGRALTARMLHLQIQINFPCNIPGARRRRGSELPHATRSRPNLGDFPPRLPAATSRQTPDVRQFRNCRFPNFCLFIAFVLPFFCNFFHFFDLQRPQVNISQTSSQCQNEKKRKLWVCACLSNSQMPLRSTQIPAKTNFGNKSQAVVLSWASEEE